MPHLLENEMTIALAAANAACSECLSKLADRVQNQLSTAQPEAPVVLPPNIGAAGDNKEGIEISYINGVRFIRSLVPDFLIMSLNRMNNLGDILRPVLEASVDAISQARFQMAVSVHDLQTTLNAALQPGDAVLADVTAMGEQISAQVNIPIVQMISQFVPNVVKAAAPMLLTTPPPNNVIAFKQSIPVISEAITSATGCVTALSTNSARATTTANVSLKSVLQSNGFFASKGIAQSRVPGYLANIRSIAVQTIANVNACMEPFHARAVEKFAAIQKSLPAIAPAPTAVPAAVPAAIPAAVPAVAAAVPVPPSA